MFRKRLAVFAVCLVVVVAGCTSTPPATTPTSTPRTVTSVPASLTDNPRVNPDNKEVFDTGCDFPAIPVQEAILPLGAYQVKVEIRRSDVIRCNTLHWVRMTPIALPAGLTAKDFAAVLRMGTADSELANAATQFARPSKPEVELITKGRTAEAGERLQACLYLLKNDQLSDAFNCAPVYTVSKP